MIMKIFSCFFFKGEALNLNYSVEFMNALTLNLDTVQLTDEQFYQLCKNNCELNFELTAKGELIIIKIIWV